MKKRKIRLAIILVFVIIFVVTLTSFAAVNEICFGEQHPYVPWYNTLLQKNESIDVLDSTAATSSVHGGLDNYGYYNKYYYTNNAAQTIRDSMANNGIFLVYSHGLPGRMLNPYNGTLGWTMTYLTANSTSDNRAFSIKAKYTSSTSISKIRLAFFCGCQTAATDTNYGNLLNATVGAGAKCALGYKQPIKQTAAAYMSYRILCYYGADHNNTVAASCTSTIREAVATYGSSSGSDSLTIAGDGSIKLAPAAYGS